MQSCPTFTQTISVRRQDADFAGRMKPGALLRYAQQIATDHCTAVGFDLDFYRNNHCGFVIVKQELRFTRVPMVDEVLTLTTMPEKARHATSRRMLVVKDASGDTVAQVFSWWVLMDSDTRRIMRRRPAEMEQFWPEKVDLTQEYCLPQAEVLTPGAEITADYLVCDTNRHINNCVYADLACGAVPLDQLEDKPIRRMLVSYHREVQMGDSMTLASGTAEDGWYTTGTRKSDGLTAFEAFCSL